MCRPNRKQPERQHRPVENDGPCIPHDQLDKIFKPFYQYYGTQVNATVKGSGLGLPLAHSPAEMLGSGRYRIKEVSAATGFSSVAYFTSCFMRQFGLTPGAFMKKKD